MFVGALVSSGGAVTVSSCCFSSFLIGAFLGGAGATISFSGVFLFLGGLAVTALGLGVTILGLDISFSSSSEDAKKSTSSESESGFSFFFSGSASIVSSSSTFFFLLPFEDCRKTFGRIPPLFGSCLHLEDTRCSASLICAQYAIYGSLAISNFIFATNSFSRCCNVL